MVEARWAVEGADRRLVWVTVKVSGTENDDYLAHFITKEFVDAEAETMQQVSSGLLEQGTCS